MATHKHDDQAQKEFEDAFNNDPEMKPAKTDDEEFGTGADKKDDPDTSSGAAANDKTGQVAGKVGETSGSPDAQVIGRQHEGGKPSNGVEAKDTAVGGPITRMAEGGDAHGKKDTTGVDESGSATDNGIPSKDADELGEPADGGTGAGLDFAAETRTDEKTESNDEQAKERQRLSSWEGRLKAMERDLQAKGAAAGEKPADAISDALDEVAGGAGDKKLAEAASAASEAVESGDMTASEAIRSLTEDFGESFVKHLQAIASAAAGDHVKSAVGEQMGKVTTDLADVISHIRDSADRAHFESIAKAHPDFVEKSQSPEFAAFVAALPEAEKAKAESTQAGGSAAEIIKLLGEFDSSKPKPEAVAAAAPAAAGAPQAGPAPADEEQLDAAAGVRSGGGMTLPTQPVAADDYAGAWGKADDMPVKRA